MKSLMFSFILMLSVSCTKSLNESPSEMVPSNTSSKSENLTETTAPTQPQNAKNNNSKNKNNSNKKKHT